MSGDPVVLIPPMLSDARVFQDQIAAISQTNAVLVCPPSAAETIESLADRVLDVAPKQFALAGFGLGGAIALDIIHRVPDRVSRIALINTTAQADTPKIAGDRETEIIAAKAGRFGDVIDHTYGAATLIGQGEGGGLAGRLRQMGDAIGADVYVAQARALQKRKDQQAILRQIRQPTIVISSDSDPDLPLRRQEFIAEMIPYAQHCVIRDAGRMPTLEQPEQVTEAMLDWLRQPLVLR